MATALTNAEILTQVLREKSQMRYPVFPELKLVSSCDGLSGQFLLIRIGWEKKTWCHDILFHAELIGDKIVIQADLTEGLKPLLLEAGIPAEAFLSDRDYNWREASKAAAA